MSSIATDPFSPGRLGPITIPNRFIKAATFEGMAIDNKMSDAIVDFHEAPARGGLGTVSYTHLRAHET